MSIKKKILNNASEHQINILRSVRDQYRDVFDPYPYRRYTKKRKCIFIHIPKAAGTSILTALGGWAGDHCTYREYLQASPTKFKKYFKFCFVRNPYDRLVSTYEYLKQGGNKTSDIRMQALLIDKYDTFEKFVLDFLNEEIIYRVNLLKPQFWFVYNEYDELMVDFIGKFESIPEDVCVISNRIAGSELSLPKLNASKRKEYNAYYTDELRCKIYELYRKDFLLFNYAELG